MDIFTHSSLLVVDFARAWKLVGHMSRFVNNVLGWGYVWD